MLPDPFYADLPCDKGTFGLCTANTVLRTQCEHYGVFAPGPPASGRCAREFRLLQLLGKDVNQSDPQAMLVAAVDRNNPGAVQLLLADGRFRAPTTTGPSKTRSRMGTPMWCSCCWRTAVFERQCQLDHRIRELEWARQGGAASAGGRSRRSERQRQLGHQRRELSVAHRCGATAAGGRPRRSERQRQLGHDIRELEWARQGGATAAGERPFPSAGDNEAIKDAIKNGHVKVVQLLLADPRVNANLLHRLLYNSSRQGSGGTQRHRDRKVNPHSDFSDSGGEPPRTRGTST